MRSSRTRTPALAAVLILTVAAGCGSESADDDRLDPDGESIIDEDIGDGSVIRQPGGVTNQLDGVDGDVEDEPEVGVD